MLFLQCQVKKIFKLTDSPANKLALEATVTDVDKVTCQMYTICSL